MYCGCIGVLGRTQHLTCSFLFLFKAIFTVTLGPFAFFNVQKTKYLQIFTTLMRWVGKWVVYLYFPDFLSYYCFFLISGLHIFEFLKFGLL